METIVFSIYIIGVVLCWLITGFVRSWVRAKPPQHPADDPVVGLALLAFIWPMLFLGGAAILVVTVPWQLGSWIGVKCRQ